MKKHFETNVDSIFSFKELIFTFVNQKKMFYYVNCSKNKVIQCNAFFSVSVSV